MHHRQLTCFFVSSLLLAACGDSSDSDNGPGATQGTGGSAGTGGSSATGGAAGSKAGTGGASTGGTGGKSSAGGASGHGGAGVGGSSAGAGGSAGPGGAGGSAGPGGAGGSAGPGGAGGSAGPGGAGGSGPGGSGGSGGGSGGESAGGSGGTGALAVTPANPTLLTCSTTAFSSGGVAATWTATAGTIDTNGSYVAPIQVGPDVTITATSKADTTISGSTNAKLVTAIAGAKESVASMFDTPSDIAVHALASKGDRVYAIYGDNAGAATPEVRVIRSDDGGATWAKPIVASPPILAGSGVSCVSIAIDAADPDVVYATFDVDAGSGIAPQFVTGIDDSRALLLVVSTDGGKTWPTSRMLQSGNSADAIPVSQGICPDVASPQKDMVAVSTPGGDNDQSIFLFVDGTRGTGFAIQDSDAFNSIATGDSGALHAIAADVGQNGSEGETTQSPHLFADGKGTLCITYVAYTPKGSGSPSSAIWVQCSPDQGKTFAEPVIVSPTYAFSDLHLGHPSGSFSADGHIAVIWHGFTAETVAGVSVVGVAISGDKGVSFSNVSAPAFQEGSGGFAAGFGDVLFDTSGVLWIAYDVNDGSTARVAVDKSCDLGKTWSGALPVNEDSSGTVDGSGLPELVEASAGHVSVYTSGVDSTGVTREIRRYTLTP